MLGKKSLRGSDRIGGCYLSVLYGYPVSPSTQAKSAERAMQDSGAPEALIRAPSCLAKEAIRRSLCGLSMRANR